jgi:TRAP transporter 4TM/12TM fusion protein
VFFFKAAGLLAIAWSLFQLYTAGFGFLNAMLMRPIHLGFALAITFLTYSWKGKADPESEEVQETKIGWSDVFLALLSIAMVIYMVLHQERIISREGFVDPVFGSDIFFGIILVLLIMEAARRLFGNLLPTLAGIFLAYQFFGQNLPGILSHRGINFAKFTDSQFLSTSGIFSTPLSVSTDTVFYFLLFGAFLEISGGGKFFIDLAVRIAGRFRGGPAKVAIIASGLMGSINGSAVGNVASTGVFTIPLMKKIGYSPVFAGAVEACASTGGQIMPPIMGAAAFVLAQFVGIPYADVVIAAIIPAFLYYIALFIAVDIRAKELNLLGIDVKKSGLISPDWWKRSYLLLPVVVLIYMILKGYTLQYAAVVATLSIIPIGWLRTETRIKLGAIIKGLESAGRKAIVVAIPCALAGILVGVVSYTGLGAKFSAFLLKISGGDLLLTLFVIMIACIVMGMAMPTTAAYIITAALMAPALTEIGVEPLAAHMFIFYFAILSMITPPVALASYTGAGIAGADLMKTGYQGWFLALSGFIIPYAFVMNTSLLGQGEMVEIARTVIGAIIGVYALSKGVVSVKIPWWLRTGYGVSGVMLISPQMVTDMLGIAGLAICIFVQRFLIKEKGISKDGDVSSGTLSQ